MAIGSDQLRDDDGDETEHRFRGSQRIVFAILQNLHDRTDDVIVGRATAALVRWIPG